MEKGYFISFIFLRGVCSCWAANMDIPVDLETDNGRIICLFSNCLMVCPCGEKYYILSEYSCRGGIL